MPRVGRDTWEILQETQSNKVKFSGSLKTFWGMSPKFWDDIPGGFSARRTLFTPGSAQTAFVRAVSPYALAYL